MLASVLMLPPYIASSSKESALVDRLVSMNLESPTVSLEDLNNFIEKINTTLSMFNSNEKARDVYQTAFKPVLDARPGSVAITQLIYQDRGGDIGATIELHGVALDRASLQSFKAKLEETKSFTTVDVPISNFVKRNNIDFNINLYLK